MNKTTHYLAVLAVAVSAIGTACASPVFNSVFLQTQDGVNYTDGTYVGDVVNVTSIGPLPWSATSTASASQTSSAVSTYDFSSTSWNVSMQHNPADSVYLGGTFPAGSIGASYGNISFTPDAAMNYSLSGAYAFSGGLGDLVMDVFLKDQTTNTMLFYGRQWSISVNGASFVLGGTSGTYYNYLVGSLTGSLIAGNDYTYYYSYYTKERQNGDTISGSGNVQLTLTPQSIQQPGAVPEPATLALLGFGLAGIAFRRKRGNKKTS